MVHTGRTSHSSGLASRLDQGRRGEGSGQNRGQWEGDGEVPQVRDRTQAALGSPVLSTSSLRCQQVNQARVGSRQLGMWL